MACFWQGIFKSLSKNDREQLGLKNNSLTDCIKLLKQKNTQNIKVLWQKTTLSKKQSSENYEHIENYNINNYNKGYLCGTCDPFLILLCHLLSINITHIYLGHKIIYSNNSNRTYIFNSNRGHFTFSKKSTLDNPKIRA